ncbi:MAG: hypothetical protein NZO58_13665 [Gemmataceae bacterium]|nr:hypothetical protein [Gemmataceae bacterium]
MKYLFAGVVAALSLVLVLGENKAGDGKPKHTIAEVMAKAMKGGLCKKCASGEATEAEKKELVELFTSLSQNEPPKGDLKDWKKRTGALLDAAKKIAAGDEKAGKALGAAANCAACHKAHKG